MSLTFVYPCLLLFDKSLFLTVFSSSYDRYALPEALSLKPSEISKNDLCNFHRKQKNFVLKNGIVKDGCYCCCCNSCCSCCCRGCCCCCCGLLNMQHEYFMNAALNKVVCWQFLPSASINESRWIRTKTRSRWIDSTPLGTTRLLPSYPAVLLSSSSVLLLRWPKTWHKAAAESSLAQSAKRFYSSSIPLPSSLPIRLSH